MRRSICYCEPALALAGETNTWNFIFIPSTNLPKGTRLKFDLLSRGREIDWELPETSLKKQKNVLFAVLENGKPLAAKEVQASKQLPPQYEFTLPAKLDAGSPFQIVLGSVKDGAKLTRSAGNKAQCTVERRRTFHLYTDSTGKGRYTEPELFTIDIRGNTLETIRILSPSFVQRNRRFDVTLRFEDAFGNLTSQAPDDTLIELTHERLRETLSWKLFVPETGFISLPNLYFNEAGVYTFQLKNPQSKEIFFSPPIHCFEENPLQLFWGTLHGESERYDSTDNMENCIRHFRDEESYHFYASSPFENEEETPVELWKHVTQNVADFNEEDRMITLLGFQWQGAPKKEGIRQLLFAKDNKPILRKKETKTNTLDKIYSSYSGKELIAIPCMTMAKGCEYDFKNFNPEFERVVEIYNSWGSSECSKKDGNPLPIHGTGKKTFQENPDGAVQKALQNNCRFGFVGGGLDDRGTYADLYETNQQQYSPGLTTIIAAAHNRQTLFEALYNRACYATTGQRIIIGFFLAGLPMGSETSTEVKLGLAVNRHLSGYVAGTTTLSKIEIIRNGKVLTTFKPKDYWFDFTYDDLIPIDKVTIKPKDKKPPFVYYYLRVTQEDGHMAWSSPIWVDDIPTKPPLKNLGKKPAPQKIDFSVDDEEDDEDDE